MNGERTRTPTKQFARMLEASLEATRFNSAEYLERKHAELIAGFDAFDARLQRFAAAIESADRTIQENNRG